jgi:hypothetical protein
MAQLRALAVRLAFMTLIGTAACGDGGKAPGFPPDDEDADVTGDEDAGDASDELDGGTRTDGSTGDTGMADGADEDGGAEDGATAVDAGDISECEGDLLEFSGARAVGRPLTAGISGNTVHLVYLVPSGGGTSANNNAQGLRYVSFDTTGEAGMGVDVANVGIDTYSRTRDPSLVVGPSKIELFYTSNSAGPYELFYKELTGTAPASRETTTSGTPRNEYALAAGLFGDGAAVAYSSEPTSINVPGSLALKLPGMAATELVAEAAGYHAAQIAFSQVGNAGARHGVAAFLSDLSSKPGVFAIPVASNGTPDGALITLTTQIGGASGVDISRGKDGRGALIWTETPAGSIHQLRFRNIAEDGTISGTVRALTTGNQDLRDISIAQYSGGYVIAYRRVGGVLGQAASVYLLFIDIDGNRSGTRLVHTASLSGGGLKVLVANDGRLIVLWADTENVVNETTKQTETALKVRAARLNCAF